ncbi:flagellar biosynthetic protein FliR [Helicobacter winghamensis]|uniref:flagellar biosynthetic protein FliR n=1 Tax=Helicobacter winghamensis TaxID=157268 RepID=UPI0018A60A0F|nr:flagellar biosynthetic protein FliR [Helicobacter winghamensis]QOQ98197.1 flagellar type III secretion system protein FliR [Helicobacter winghamensis]
MELLAYLTEGNVANFLLLLLRFAGIIAFFPFFENQLITAQLKGALIFLLTIFFIPLLDVVPPSEWTILRFIAAGLSEVMLGFLASMALQIVFGMISFGGELISFAMGLTIANAYDPVTGAQKPIVGQLLTLLALLIMLGLDYHHLFFYFVSESVKEIPLGGFMYSQNYIEYIIKSFSHLFVIGLTMSFPIIALILLSDIIFGMIMKAHPQFNLLAIGFPVKIAIAFAVLIVIVPAIILHFKREFLSAFDALTILFQNSF